MKNILIIAVICLSALTARAQTIEVVCGSTPRIFLEKTLVSDNATTFGYMEAAFGGAAYAQFFQEYKWWSAPVYVHGEYRTTFDGNHTAMAGISYSFILPHGNISLAPLYRYDIGINKHAAQLGNAYFVDWGWLELYGYNDLWYNGAVNFYGEQRAHLRITEHYKIGAIVDISYFGEFAIVPSLGMRIDF